MALIDRIVCNTQTSEELVWKWPSDHIRLGSQLVVNSSQEALFVKGGRALDLFGPGTHSLSSRNLPLLDKLVNLPYGGTTPFTAEVWFVNQTSKLDMKWGTAGPIQVVDRKYGIPVSLRVFGQYGIRVADTRSFIQQLVGTHQLAISNEILGYFASRAIQQLSTALAAFLNSDVTSVFDIAASLNEISSIVQNQLEPAFSQFGIELLSFDIARASIPDDEMMQFQAGFDKRMEIENVGRTPMNDSYVRMRQLDALASLGSSAEGAIFLGNSVLNGGIQPITSVVPTSTTSNNTAPEERLRKLKLIYEQGLITDAEYASKRDSIIAEI